MGQRCIEIGSLLRHIHLRTDILRISYLPHQVHPIGNHNQDDTHVLGEGKQKVPEVLTLDNGVILVELLNAVQTMQDTRHLIAILLPDLLRCQPTLLDLRNQIDSLDGITFQSDFLFKNFSCLSCHSLLFFVCK